MGRNGEAIEELLEVMDRLLGENGCPWDRAQTHESLLRYLLEETYEVIEAVKDGDMDKLEEELGDLLLQVVFHAALARKEGFFDFADIALRIKDKMIKRHPHVFGEDRLSTPDDVMEVWEKFKKREGKKYILEGIPSMLPALLRAYKIQEKAARVGFDWPDVEGALDKFKEEIEELKKARDREELKEEIGDIFFALVNIARMQGIEPEEALQATNDKFVRRFNYVEEQVKASGRDFSGFTLEELDGFWEKAKKIGL
ncbi:tetrapyrrole methylase family protein / MazG family protein [Thermosyntropha lipolytica DSM 11003]|uniref:Tetrapyrrole methylase family protein / MazG family protein n=1 Tax=Thermosyntropha lipolytica DSM 11003 TaxID=1123382 RepID=A0A1M5JT39_9FIRM|nr:nucleoside triphosphate pyrophosphohydrolase [Thermosyntropha lipolytica]SHG43439.1 tetrapyrrole methylase family protein / MazG family protein [Thermosyntropha lipolytica DSM 11003]